MAGVMKDSPAIRLAVAAAPVVFVLMWATGFVVARLSAPHADPLTFLGIRFPIAGVLFALIALALAAPWPGARQAFHASVAGAFLHGGYLGPVYWAVAHGMPAGVSALIAACNRALQQEQAQHPASNDVEDVEFIPWDGTPQASKT